MRKEQNDAVEARSTEGREEVRKPEMRHVQRKRRDV